MVYEHRQHNGKPSSENSMAPISPSIWQMVRLTVDWMEQSFSVVWVKLNVFAASKKPQYAYSQY